MKNNINILKFVLSFVILTNMSDLSLSLYHTFCKKGQINPIKLLFTAKIIYHFAVKALNFTGCRILLDNYKIECAKISEQPELEFITRIIEI